MLTAGLRGRAVGGRRRTLRFLDAEWHHDENMRLHGCHGDLLAGRKSCVDGAFRAVGSRRKQRSKGREAYSPPPGACQ